MSELILERPSEKQRLFMLDTHKYIGYGGARGGGKSWAVRNKAVLLCYKYPGIKVLIVRKTYPELWDNHIEPLTRRNSSHFPTAARYFSAFAIRRRTQTVSRASRWMSSS